MTEADAAAGGGGGGGGGRSHKTKKNDVERPLTKGQRRKHVNPSNTWPQQPKIQSAAARAKANLRVAGLLSDVNNNKKSSVVPTLDPTLDLNSPEVRFGRLLGAPEQRKRHAAIGQLESYLKQRCDIHNNEAGISEMDLLKLWKGMWYTLYLADKVPVQEELAKRLAELIWCLAGTEEEDECAAQMYLDMCNQEETDFVMEEIVNTVDQENDEDNDGERQERASDELEAESDDDDDADIRTRNGEERTQDEEEAAEEEAIPDELIQHCRGAHLAALFVKVFFRTIQREWGKMDKHRIDKFYTLVRLVYREIFRYMASRHWNRGIVFLFNDILRNEVLFDIPNGLRCHLIDIAVPELALVNRQAPMPLTEATILDCLDPYFALAQNSDDSMVHGRVMEKIFGKFLEEFSIVSERHEDDDEEGGDLVMDQVHVGTIAKFLFELGSDVDTQERYRKPLYDMHKTYMKRLKLVGRDVVLDAGSADETEEQHDMEVTEEVEDIMFQEESQMLQEMNRTASKRKAVEDAGVERPQLDESMNSLPAGGIPSPKKNTQETEAFSAVKVTPGAEATIADEEGKAATSKKAKKRKKKKKSAVAIDQDSKGEEEVITISYSEQKMAAQMTAGEAGKGASAEKKDERLKSLAASTPRSATVTNEEKHVKFGRPNHSKSYKASMKGLEKVKHTPKTPEYGILRSKTTGPASSGSAEKKSSQKRKRKRKRLLDSLQ